MSFAGAKYVLQALLYGANPASRVRLFSEISRKEFLGFFMDSKKVKKLISNTLLHGDIDSYSAQNSFSFEKTLVSIF